LGCATLGSVSVIVAPITVTITVLNIGTTAIGVVLSGALVRAYYHSKQEAKIIGL